MEVVVAAISSTNSNNDKMGNQPQGPQQRI
jgi:hypothetical protein